MGLRIASAFAAAVWVLAALMNLASPSSWERFLWGPVALVLAVLCLVVARSRAGSQVAVAIDPSGT